MKQHCLILYVIFFGLFSAFISDQPCKYADSNIGYVKTEIEKAIAIKDLQLVRYHTYKALSAIEKSKKQLQECGCKYAIENIKKGSEHLKMASKATSLVSSAILLNKALEETIESVEALNNHELHDSLYGNDKLTINSASSEKKKASVRPPTENILKQKIDSSLSKYRKSLERVVNTVNCIEARDFADGIYNHCEQQLLRSELSEGKKYYNLKVKEITSAALEKLGDCSNR